MNEPFTFNVRAIAVAGAISHGLLALAQHRPDQDDQLPRHVARRALQGGSALGTGALAWNCFSRGSMATGMTTVLLTAGVLLVTAEKSAGFITQPFQGDNHV